MRLLLSQHQTSNMKTFYFLLVFLSFYFLFLNLDKTAAAGLSLAISPPLIQITSLAPAQIKTPMTIQNLGDESIELDILLKPLTTLNNQRKAPSIFDKIQILEENAPVQSLALAPKQRKKLFLKIDIPVQEPDSDHYFSLLFISKASTLKDNLNYSQVIGGVGINVLLSIGQQNPSSLIEEFSAPLFLGKGAVPFTLKIKNTSSHFITPRGEIVIKNMFGKIVGRIEMLPENILINSSRYIKRFWNESFLLGAYKANLNISLSQKSPIYKESISFFVIPVQAIVGALTFLLISLLIYRRVKKNLFN